MRKPVMVVTSRDEAINELVRQTEHKLLAVWAADCAERVLHYFEAAFPDDDRPRRAIAACREWAATGIFSMKVIRKASLDSHAAAREAADYSPARSAARAAGQAVATAHVITHAPGAGIYAASAERDAATPENAIAAAEAERDWQYQHLLNLREQQAVS